MVLIVFVAALLILASIVDALFESAPDERFRRVPMTALYGVSEILGKMV